MLQLPFLRKIIAKLSASNATLVTAESITAGLITSSLAAIPGASAVLYGGFVTYQNAAKISLLGIPPTLLEEHSAVSQVIAESMALNALKKTAATYAIATTGYAGPNGADQEKTGLCFICVAQRLSTKPTVLKTSHYYFLGERNTVRKKAARQALVCLDSYLID